MDPISFALALGGIPAIFMSCVNCFRCIQLGREFENDFEVARCKLEAAEMRLVRWGTSLGISSHETKLFAEDYSEGDIVKAYHWLKEIRRAFDAARETSSRYQKTARPDRVQLLDTNQTMNKEESPLRSLHYKMHRINDARVRLRINDRITWALYRKGNFETLIENVSDLTNNLIELFPSMAHSQSQLCRVEIQDLDANSLNLLNKVAGDNDTILHHIIKLEMEQRPNVFSGIEVRERFQGHFGDNVAAGEKSRSSIYSNILAGGNAFVHFGNNIGFVPRDTSGFCTA